MIVIITTITFINDGDDDDEVISIIDAVSPRVGKAIIADVLLIIIDNDANL